MESGAPGVALRGMPFAVPHLHPTRRNDWTGNTRLGLRSLHVDGVTVLS